MRDIQQSTNARQPSRDLRPRIGSRSISAPRELGKPRLVSLPKLLPLGLIKVFALAILACFASFWVLLHQLTSRDHDNASAPATSIATSTTAPGEIWVDVDAIESPQQSATASTNH
jgi:hypothetical protein